MQLGLSGEDILRIWVIGFKERVVQTCVILVTDVQPGLRHYGNLVDLGDTLHSPSDFTVILISGLSILAETMLQIISPDNYIRFNYTYVYLLV